METTTVAVIALCYILLLGTLHGIKLSLRQLQRIVRQMGLRIEGQVISVVYSDASYNNRS